MHLGTFVETVLEKYLCCNVLLLKANPRETDIHTFLGRRKWGNVYWHCLMWRNSKNLTISAWTKERKYVWYYLYWNSQFKIDRSFAAFPWHRSAKANMMPVNGFPILKYSYNIKYKSKKVSTKSTRWVQKQAITSCFLGHRQIVMLHQKNSFRSSREQQNLPYWRKYLISPEYFKRKKENYFQKTSFN